MTRAQSVSVIVLAATAAMAPATVRAADEEIQVYMDEMDPQGGVGLDMHVNYVPQGRVENADYAGQMTSKDRLRVTPEWSYGLTNNIELGLYMPLMTIDPNGGFELGGVKGRIKYIAPRPEGSPVFYGVNFELGRVRHALDVNPWNAELKFIGGYRQGPWTLAGNFNMDFVVSGPESSPMGLELDTKLDYAVTKTLALGLESYNDLGSTREFGHLGSGDERIFAAADATIGMWDLNLGVGRGWSEPEDQWVLKAVIGVPID